MSVSVTRLSIQADLPHCTRPPGLVASRWVTSRSSAVSTPAPWDSTSAPSRSWRPPPHSCRPGAEGLLELPYWTGVLTPYRDTLVGLTGSHGKAHVVFAELSEVAR